METSEYRVWAVVDVKRWGPRPGATQARVQRALKHIVDSALRSVDLRLEQLPLNKPGDGLVLPLPGDISKARVTTTFVDELVRRLGDHNDASSDDEAIRLRLALHAGEGIDGDGQWSGAAVVHACRLVNASGLKRALAAAKGHPLALIVSAHWYDAVIREGYAPPNGYREIAVRDETKEFFANAWVRVPGLTHPPGLTEEDDARPPPPPPRSSSSAGQRDSVQITINDSTFEDLVGHDKHVYFGAPPNDALTDW